ncbi:hypothetical protein LWI29_006682 [Acer saccharum]|uniref:Reverse transcriptase zinc-binding domain-containing protein n=1 Tax=Acer saccharum TaxID=4024 RepID=A0AA39SIA8_ACESA|nr:hypothetical protein LWI29_006682 [Acer saccharum]
MRGGLGFRDLETFNRALLAKQCWRIIENPDSLAGKVLKNCYFPDSSFLEANPKSKGSLIWQGLLWGRGIIDIGSRWRIGNGCFVRVYGDRWIPRPSTFQIILPIALAENTTVACLKTASGGWNINLLRNTFVADDVDLILSIPPASPSVNDSLLWHFEKDGRYSVRSGYRVGRFLSGTPSSSGLDESISWWKALWRLKIPPKIKVFLWRASNHWLPTSAYLAKRGIPLSKLCPRYRRCPESMVHALWGCVL